MAIQDSFDLSKALVSQSYAYKCWYNAKYCGNTMKIGSEDLTKITQAWNSQLSKWKMIAESDENVYELDDTEISNAHKVGRENAVEAAGGYKGGKNGKNIAVGAQQAAVSLGGAAISAVGKVAAQKAGLKIGQAVTGKAANAIAEAGAKKGASEGAKNAAKNVGKAKFGAYVGAAIAIATAAKYLITKPQHEEKEALKKLNEEMITAQQQIVETKSQLQDYNENVEQMSAEAEEVNEQTNGEMEKNKAEYDVYERTYMAIIEKMQSGEPLTEDEKQLLKSLIPIMYELGLNVADLQTCANEDVKAILEDMSSYTDGFDAIREFQIEKQELTDLAASFDSTTRTMCYIEAGSQTLNAATGVTSGTQLLAGGPWNWALGIAAIAAGGASGVFAGKEMADASKISTEIGNREMTQEANESGEDSLLSQYEESIDDFDSYMDLVSNLELEVPDDMPKDEDEAGELGKTLEDGAASALTAAPASPTVNSNPFGGTPVEKGNTQGTGSDPSDPFYKKPEEKDE